MAEVARAAGLSVMTVSYTYSQPARVSERAGAQVRAAARQLGYPARTPAPVPCAAGAPAASGLSSVSVLPTPLRIHRQRASSPEWPRSAPTMPSV